jgi:hypothetical protein
MAKHCIQLPRPNVGNFYEAHRFEQQSGDGPGPLHKCRSPRCARTQTAAKRCPGVHAATNPRPCGPNMLFFSTKLASACATNVTTLTSKSCWWLAPRNKTLHYRFAQFGRKKQIMQAKRHADSRKKSGGHCPPPSPLPCAGEAVPRLGPFKRSPKQ